MSALSDYIANSVPVKPPDLMLELPPGSWLASRLARSTAANG